MKKLTLILTAILGLLVAGGCTTTNHALKDENLTVAKAQREIRVGMPSAEVVEALGSPNMVTTDSQRRETWVYDKVSTTIQSDSSSAGVWFLLVAGKSGSSRTTQNQRTLTIIVKFDEKGLVRDFSYRTSSF